MNAFDTIYEAFALDLAKRIDRLITTGEDVPNPVGEWVNSFGADEWEGFDTDDGENW